MTTLELSDQPHPQRWRIRLAAMLLLTAGTLASALPPMGAHAAPPEDPVPTGLVRITIKFLRHDGGTARQPVRLVASSCQACMQKDDPRYARENARETIVELDIPRQRNLELLFDAAPGVFDRAILQAQDLRPVQSGRRLRLELPPIAEEATEAGEFPTHVMGKGYVLRFEHADPARRFGAYAQALPTDQRLAANQLEFAFREAVLELGLGEQAEQDRLGIIEIMGFDTNAPHGHEDAPPHVHMHLRWPYNTGTQVGHFYLGAGGRIDHTTVGIAGLHAPERVFLKGQRFDTISPAGRVFYSQTISPDGGLVLSVPDGRSCLIGLPGDDFRQAIRLACSGHEAVTIQVADDLADGVLTVRTGAIAETFRYDPRTGVLISPQAPPVPEPSAIVPTGRPGG